MSLNSQRTSGKLFYTGRLILGLAILAAIGFSIYYLIRSLLHLATVNPTVATAFVTGAITIVASVSAVVLGRYFERRKEVEQALLAGMEKDPNFRITPAVK